MNKRKLLLVLIVPIGVLYGLLNWNVWRAKIIINLWGADAIHADVAGLFQVVPNNQYNSIKRELWTPFINSINPEYVSSDENLIILDLGCRLMEECGIIIMKKGQSCWGFKINSTLFEGICYYRHSI